MQIASGAREIASLKLLQVSELSDLKCMWSFMDMAWEGTLIHFSWPSPDRKLSPGDNYSLSTQLISFRTEKGICLTLCLSPIVYLWAGFACLWVGKIHSSRKEAVHSVFNCFSYMILRPKWWALMEVFTQIVLKVEFDVPLLLRLFSEGDGWIYLLRHDPLTKAFYLYFF